ncbi:MAG TPA: DUF5723 family protein [Saprospiraceae bacterium]|nr:DUF5723 family protein [Saprospiraceae bacterium]HNT21014.1 DUF5723 family protein [Saprospiraceae bacterium]
MKHTLRRILTPTLMCAVTALSAQDRGISLFNNTQIYTGRNPALPFPKEFVIGLPEGAGSLVLETGKGPWLIDRADGGKDFSLASGWAGLEKNNYFIDGEWKVRTFFLGKKWKYGQLGLSHEWEGHSSLRFNKDLVGLLGFGNYGYLQVEPRASSQPLDLKSEGEHFIFQAFTLQSALFRNKWSVGAAVRYLGGIQDFHTDILKLKADIRDPLVLKMEEDWSFYSADLVETFSVDSIRLSKSNGLAPGRHPGFAFSIGVQYKAPRWRAALQLKDLGSIRWRKGNRFSRSGNTLYQGIQGIDFLNLNENIFDQVRDTLHALAGVEKSEASFTRSLPASLLAENQVYFSDRWTVGFSADYIFSRDYGYLMAGAVYRPFPIWSFGGQMSLDTRKDWNLGLLTSLELGVFNLFFATDHVPALWKLNKADRLQARFGLALMWD